MAKLPQDTWNPHFLSQHGIFWPLIPFASEFVQSHRDWPDLRDYQQFLDSCENPVLTESGKKVTFVSQEQKVQQLEEGYEPRIFLKGEVQTRLQNWHDFFQVLVWRMFPGTKALINALHARAIMTRVEQAGENSSRGPLENALTQFDECGAVILSSRVELLQLVRDFAWKRLFWEKRDDVQQHLKCVVFGHAIYEKAINPYLGMTAHGVLVLVDDAVLQGTTTQLISVADRELQALFSLPNGITSPQDFCPFPLLGVPGWHTDNDQENFYNNRDYFRPGRRSKTF